MKKLLMILFSAMLMACAWSTAASAATVFQDTFELNVFSGGVTESNINAELPGPRQAGGSVESGYTVGGDIFLHDNSLAGSDALTFRTNSTDVAVSAGVSADIDHDFGPELAGQKYSLKVDARVDHSPGISTDNWIGFGIGDTPSDGPAAASSDLSMLFRLDGGWTLFEDGTTIVLGSGSTSTPDSGIRAGSEFTMQFDFDETGPDPLISITIDATLGPVTLDLFGGNIAFAGPGTGFESGGRFFEFRGHQSTSVDPTANIDFRIDNLTITTIPEPSSLLLMAFAGIGCLTTRRRK